MEKFTPHCKLTVVNALIRDGKVRLTKSAHEGGVALGFEFNEMLDVILSLTNAHFYKSMTSHADHKVWQDVYRPETPQGNLYLKLTVIDDLLIVSFKER